MVIRSLSSFYGLLKRGIAEECFGRAVEDACRNVGAVLIEQPPCRAAHDPVDAGDGSPRNGSRWRFVVGGDPYLARARTSVVTHVEAMLVWVVDCLDRPDLTVERCGVL